MPVFFPSELSDFLQLTLKRSFPDVPQNNMRFHSHGDSVLLSTIMHCKDKHCADAFC